MSYKILIISRSTLYSSPGGDTIQIVETANALRKLGLFIDVKLTHEYIAYEQYDLLHFFNIIRPNDILRHTKKANKPFVVSTIFVDYKEYEKFSRKGIAGILNKVLSGDQIESLKAIVRSVKGQEKLPLLTYFLKGHKRSIKYVIRNASVLLPNSESEYRRLFAAYQTPQKYVVVPNGVDIDRFAYNEEEHRDIVLCVARFEPLKNQLNLIRAVKGTGFKLYLIGNPSLNSEDYYLTCKKEATANVTFVNHISQAELIDYYKRAKVHVLASWFETTGLSSLEAASVGCNIVISDKGDTVDYFADNAEYCDPSSVESIRSAIEIAFTKKTSPLFSQNIKKKYTWKKAGEKTLEAYNHVTRTL